MKTVFQIRAVQLDLARQMESLSFIKEFIDLAAGNGFNTLFLYLEWRVRTKCVDLGEKDSYSREELQEIIAYAAGRNITVIPGLAALGHGDILLKYPQYKHLSELREGIPGRFPGSEGEAIDLCPSLPETGKLLKEYLTECAEIFQDSPYLHVGCDEVHNIGYCELCRKKVTSYEEEGKLFLEHLLFLHDIVKSTSKKMMIWDDMMEFFEEIIPLLPKDIVLVSWLYDENIYQYKGHFFNQNFKDMLAGYEEAGLEYLIAPADSYAGNISSFTKYGEKYRPLGGLLTTWEKTGTLLYKSFPSIAFCGKLWSRKWEESQDAMDLALKELFPSIQDGIFFSALSLYASMPNHFPVVGMRSLTLFNFNGPARSSYQALRNIKEIFSSFYEKVQSCAEKKILHDILFDCRLKLLKWESQTACWENLNGLQHTSLGSLRKKVAEESEKYLPFLLENRPYDNGEKSRNDFAAWEEALEKVAVLPEKGYLKLLFMLPDYYAAPFLTVFINGEKIASSSWKLAGAHLYYLYLPLPEGIREVEEVKLELGGYGELGIAFVAACKGKEQYLPSCVKERSGMVRNEAYVLTQDIRYTLLGKGDVEALYRERSWKNNLSSLTLEMKKK